MHEYRVEELAERAGVSVEALRAYQSKGLLPPPRHEGRVAWYGERHLERLRRIRELKGRGYSLRAIAELLKPPGPQAGTVRDPITEVEEERLTLVELAELSRVPPALLRSFEASGVLRPRRLGNEATYTSADVRAVRLLLSLLGSGVPMEEFMAVARIQLDAADDVAKGAVDLFMRYVREPLLAAGLPQKQEAERLAAAFRLLVQAATGLITYTFQRMVLEAAAEEIGQRGSRSERAALAREMRRQRIEDSLSA